EWLRHIGIYAYRAGFLQEFAALPPGRLGRVESLEQLRVLEAGFRIAAAVTPAPFRSAVGPPEDLPRAKSPVAVRRRRGGAPAGRVPWHHLPVADGRRRVAIPDRGRRAGQPGRSGLGRNR